MSEMVERVARALCVQRHGDPGDKLFIDATWPDFEPDARAAIETMWKPTDAMIDRASWHDGSETAELVWNDMIDEALKD